MITKDEYDKQLSMHKLIMGNGTYIHINGNHFDNRKSNLADIRGYKNEGKTFLNGYIAIYKPEHPRAFDNGCVYEHILVAEKILGRPLKNEECVHHKDLDRTNNDEENLMIFATNDDHIAFHGGAKPIKQDDGTYISENVKIDYHIYNNRTREDINNNIKDIGSIIVVKNKTKYNLCPICKTNLKSITASKCLECYNKDKSRNVAPKEVLQELIYKYPFTQIGKMFGVTDNTIRKWCKKYNLPFRRRDIDNNEQVS